MSIIQLEAHRVEVGGDGQEVLLEGLLHEALLLLRQLLHFLLRPVGGGSSALQPLLQMLQRGGLCQLLLVLPESQSHGQPAGKYRGGHLI